MLLCKREKTTSKANGDFENMVFEHGLKLLASEKASTK